MKKRSTVNIWEIKRKYRNLGHFQLRHKVTPTCGGYIHVSSVSLLLLLTYMHLSYLNFENFRQIYLST